MDIGIKNNQRGFTLIEIVMVIVLTGILAGVGGPLTAELIDSFSYSLYRKDLSESADIAIKRMTREIPRLRNSTSVTTASPTVYRFVDIDGNTLEFRLTGTNLVRIQGANTDVLAANVAALNFTYLDESLGVIVTPQVIPNPTNIRFININLTLTSNTNTILYSTRLRVRNVIYLSDLFS